MTSKNSLGGRVGLLCVHWNPWVVYPSTIISVSPSRIASYSIRNFTPAFLSPLLTINTSSYAPTRLYWRCASALRWKFPSPLFSNMVNQVRAINRCGLFEVFGYSWYTNPRDGFLTCCIGISIAHTNCRQVAHHLLTHSMRPSCQIFRYDVRIIFLV